MPLDDEAIGAIADLMNELKNVLGEKAFKLPSVRKAMLVLARNGWKGAEKLRKEREARLIEEDYPL